MEVIKASKEMQIKSEKIRQQGQTITFVPTMGFLHDGHLSLLREGRKLSDYLVLSIFINPTQFGPGEDLEAYPRDTEKDLDLAGKEGVDLVFMPDADKLYGRRFQTYVQLEKLPHHLCGVSRPMHFRGVATVVTKLFNIIKPHIAIFGQKDFQQLAVIRQTVSDLNFDIEIKGIPTVRENDGLAMSSRNAYLTPDQRSSAICLYKSLEKAATLVRKGEKNASVIIDKTIDFIRSYPETRIDYVSVCDPDTIESVDTVDMPVLMALAVFIGKTRLIDNMILD
ncbi:MAG: pantoate--beta-alanine ligase [Deltaproteobacteria bacterium]|nr:pantoate--beta-alanine ligase [Deltaproteobacteria bacterium]MBW2219851.1 pantoate--beta-alanine ligase [Deltaproteobacteria bacterium]